MIGQDDDRDPAHAGGDEDEGEDNAVCGHMILLYVASYSN